MDPQTTWEEMLDAISEGVFPEAKHRADALLDWLEKGGFPPQPLTRVLSDDWDRMVCRYVCQKVLTTESKRGD